MANPTKNTFIHNLEDITTCYPKNLNQVMLIKQVQPAQTAQTTQPINPQSTWMK